MRGNLALLAFPRSSCPFPLLPNPISIILVVVVVKTDTDMSSVVHGYGTPSD
jgi:hypothetical protein